MKDIVAMKAETDKFNLFYKTDNTDKEFKLLDFLKKSHLTRTTLPLAKKTPISIKLEKKTDILVKLNQVLPENRKTFWKNLPVKDH